MVLFALPCFSLGGKNRAAELAVALHHLSRHQLPNLEAAESGTSMKLDFSGTHQIQGWVEICL